MPESESQNGEFGKAMPPVVTAALAALDEHKAEHSVVLDMRQTASFTDYMIITGGRSERHVQALGDAVAERLRDQGVKPNHIEGRSEATWVLLDYIDLIVHVFTPATRDFYQLERLWRDAPLLEWVSVEPVDEA